MAGIPFEFELRSSSLQKNIRKPDQESTLSAKLILSPMKGTAKAGYWKEENTWTGIFQLTCWSFLTRFLFRPHTTTSCPIGFPVFASYNASPSARAVVSTGPMPSPPPIKSTAGSSSSISSSFRNSSCSRMHVLKHWRNLNIQLHVKKAPSMANDKLIK